MKKNNKTSIYVTSFINYFVFLIFCLVFVGLPILGEFDDTEGLKFLVEGSKSFFAVTFSRYSALLSFSLDIGPIPSIVFVSIFAFIVILFVLAIRLGTVFRRTITANAMVSVYLLIVPAFFISIDFDLFLKLITKDPLYKEATNARVLGYIVLIFAALYIITSLLLYILCLVNAGKHRGDAATFDDEEETSQLIGNDKISHSDLNDLIRNAIKDELIKNNVASSQNPSSVSVKANEPEVDLFENVTQPMKKNGALSIEDLLSDPSLAGEEVKEETSEEVITFDDEDDKELDNLVVDGPFFDKNQNVNKTDSFIVEEKKPYVRKQPIGPKKKEVSPELEGKTPPRISFMEKIINVPDELKEIYNELKNEILSYGVNSRVANGGDTFRLHRSTYAKLTLSGKVIKIYLALDPRDFIVSTIPHEDASRKDMYREIPFVFKVKSALSRRRAKELIKESMTNAGFTQGTVENIDYVKQIEEDVKSGKFNISSSEK